MSTVLAIIAIIIVLAIVIILILAAMKPDTFRVVRTTSIKAPPEKIFPLIKTSMNGARWSPYEKMDPAMKRSFSGAPSGKGARYAWEGKKAGAGSMEITEAKPSQVSLKLDFTKPFKANNLVDFTIAPQVAMQPKSPGTCTGRRRSSARSCMSSSTWTGWSARILKRASPI